MINSIDFINAHNSFDAMEHRGSFYDMALDLIQRDLEAEAYLLILATWNFAAFRYAINKFDINEFRQIVKDCKKDLEPLCNENFTTINFEINREIICKVYNRLSVVKGIIYTGASKLMHLMNKNVFVMWDKWIRDHYKIGTKCDDYLKFLQHMQEEFGKIEWNGNRTLAKAIDEYNYVIYTLPGLEKQKAKKVK